MNAVVDRFSYITYLLLPARSMIMINVDFESGVTQLALRVRVPDTTTVETLLRVINPGAPQYQFMFTDEEHVIVSHTQIRYLGLERRILHYDFDGPRNGQTIFCRWYARLRQLSRPDRCRLYQNAVD